MGSGAQALSVLGRAPESVTSIGIQPVRDARSRSGISLLRMMFIKRVSDSTSPLPCRKKNWSTFPTSVMWAHTSKAFARGTLLG